MTIIPQDLMEQLPADMDPEEVEDHVFVGHGLGGAYGETHLLSHGGRLHVFTRGSMLGKLAPVPLTVGAPPRLERGSFSSNLYVSTPHGEERIELSMFEVDRASALVEALHPGTVPRDRDAPTDTAPPAPPRKKKREHTAEKKTRPQPPPTPPASKPQPPPTPPTTRPQPPPAPTARAHTGDPHAEAARFEAALKQRPDDVVASLSLEEIYRREGDYKNLARILLDRVEHLDSVVEQVETLHEVADIFAVTGDLNQALQTLQTAYLMDHTNHETVHRLEVLAEEHNLWNKLLTDLNEDVQHLDEISARAGILVQMSRWYRKIYSRPDYADACLMHAKRLDPQNPDVIAALAEEG